MADYDFLPVSNGSGDAALMHVNGSGRIAGSTVIPVDTVTNVPAKFIGTYGVLGSNGLITAASARNFKGHVSGSTLVIDAFEPGSVDNGNNVGDVVIVKPNTGWANRVAAFIKNASGFGTPENLTAADLSATGNVTAGGTVTTGGLVSVGGSAAVPSQITPTGTDANIPLLLKGKGSAKVLTQPLILATTMNGAATGVVATLSVPAQPVATKVLLMGTNGAAFNAASAPTSSFQNFIKLTNGSGAVVTGGQDNTRSGATGIAESRVTSNTAVYDLPANTAQDFVWYVTGTPTSSSGHFVAIVFAA